MLTPVGVTTSDYIDALKADSPVHVKMTFGSQGIVLTDQDVDISSGLTMSDILNGDIDLTFGRAVMKQLSVGILNSSRVSGLIWTDEFDLELGVDIGVNTYYVKIGTFVGEKPNNINNVNIINFTAYDYMQKFDGLADDYWDGITFPATVAEIYHGLCDYCGVGYVSGDELPYIMNRTFTTAPAQLQGYTCRDLLAWLAEACGCYAKINADGNCKMVWYTDHSSSLAFALDDEFHIETADLNTGLTWDEFDEYYWNDADKLEWNDVCSYEEAYMIDCIQVKQLGADVDICYPIEPDGNVYMIVENPFLSVESAEDIENYIKPLFDRLSTHGGHLPMEVECVGNYLVETGDIISVDADGVNTLYAPVYARTLRWKGSCTDTYETTGNVERQKVSSDNREKLVARNNIRFVAKDLYYNIQSGIDIKPEGITVSGNRFIKIESGGSFDVDSTNFKIDSNNGLLQSGLWKFNNSGLTWVDSDNSKLFRVAAYKNDSQIDSPGIYYLKRVVGTQHPVYTSQLSVVCINEENNRNHTVKFDIQSQYSSSNDKSFTNIYITATSPATSNFMQILGTDNYPIDSIYFHRAIPHNTSEFILYTCDGSLINTLYPGCTNPHNYWVIFDNEVINNELYTRIKSNGLGKLKIVANIFQGDIHGNTNGIVDVYPRGLNGAYIRLQEYTYNNVVYTKILGLNSTMIFEGTLQSPSSKDIKHDIQKLPSQGEKLDLLEPVSFIYDNDGGERRHNGLIYEDVIEVMPEICSGDETAKGINYIELIPALLKEIQDLRFRVKTLEDKLNERGDN